MWWGAFTGGLQWTAQNEHHSSWGFLHSPRQALGPEGSSPKGFQSHPFLFIPSDSVIPSALHHLPESAIWTTKVALTGSPTLIKPLPPGARIHPQTAS